MSYLHIENLYKNITILEFRSCYALEKVHGTSAHLTWNGKTIKYSPGGESIHNFTKLFDDAALSKSFNNIFGESTVVVYGEAYGGKQQGMKETYGPELKFIVFEVQIDGVWQDVERADKIANYLGLEFVPYENGPTTLEWVNQQRDADSIVAIRRGMGVGKKREGVVLRPPFEVTLSNGERCIIKHKRDDFRETATLRPVDPVKLKVLDQAIEIANEWVTEMRLSHVLDKISEPHTMALIPVVISAMVEDVIRESKGEIVDSKEARKAIGNKAVELFKKRISKI